MRRLLVVAALAGALAAGGAAHAGPPVCAGADRPDIGACFGYDCFAKCHVYIDPYCHAAPNAYACAAVDNLGG
jgi:hypothetical protein